MLNKGKLWAIEGVASYDAVAHVRAETFEEAQEKAARGEWERVEKDGAGMGFEPDETQDGDAAEEGGESGAEGGESGAEGKAGEGEREEREADFWTCPEGVSERAVRAHAAIVEFLRERGKLRSGGQRVFYSPAEWRDRGETYGTRSELVIVHDGGAHAPVFNHSYEAGDLIDALAKRLRTVGVYVEQCTGWYSAVYPDGRGGRS